MSNAHPHDQPMTHEAGTLRIVGGKVYDPTHGVDGVIKDVLIHQGQVVRELPAPMAAKTIDARGMIVMPGGVDMHCHIASSSVNRARMMQGEEHASHVHRCDPKHHLRSGSGALTPSTFVTGYRYAALGYTSALEAAVSPSGARQTHMELDDTPNLDSGFLLLVANHQRVIELLDQGDEAGVVSLISQMLRRTGAWGIKVVNPGGVASWRKDAQHTLIETLDDQVAGTRVTPRLILQAMARVAEELQLPHAPHVHCNRLGIAGNVETTLATLEALAGRRVHLTHLQFHAYSKTERGAIRSGSETLMQVINASRHVTADVGQVMFGDAFTLTGDTPLEYNLWQLAGKASKPYVNIEGELEGGCGVMPIVYRDKQLLHSLQWAIGMELMLMASDPWRMLLSTDHPNGGSFLTYPAIIAALMNRNLREEQIKRAHPKAMERSTLGQISRELTLAEIAIITRAGPAKVLGLTSKGHLGEGADGDVTVYHDQVADPQKMFESPRWVIKAGRVIVEDGQLREPVAGKRWSVPMGQDERGGRLLNEWIMERGSYAPAQFGVRV